MKKLIVCLLAAALLSTALLSGCTTTEVSATETPVSSETPASSEAAEPVLPTDSVQVADIPESGNFTDEMKIPYTVDLHEYGADSVEREGDHVSSPYYQYPDFYNLTSTDTLTILPQFKTQQQTSEWSCGVSSIMMALEHYDALGDYDEESLAAMRSNGMDPAATTLFDVVNIFETIGGFEVESTYDYEGDAVYEYMTLDKIQELLANNQPILIAWSDWGGHWQTIIGYDNMGTETYQDDVLIVADSYDTTDHNQDGYGIYPAERFYYSWTMFDFFQERFDVDERDMLFCTIKPVA